MQCNISSMIRVCRRGLEDKDGERMGREHVVWVCRSDGGSKRAQLSMHEPNEMAKPGTFPMDLVFKTGRSFSISSISQFSTSTNGPTEAHPLPKPKSAMGDLRIFGRGGGGTSQPQTVNGRQRDSTRTLLHFSGRGAYNSSLVSTKR